MKKGKKMPSIEIEGQSDARFELRDGKIVRVDASARQEAPGGVPEAPQPPEDRFGQNR